MSGDLPQLTSPDPRLNLDLQSPDRPGLRSPDLPR
jgi:hypothetical protein